jgi:hypothetical protein
MSTQNPNLNHAEQIQISNILYVKRDRFSQWQDADGQYHRLLRESLGKDA